MDERPDWRARFCFRHINRLFVSLLIIFCSLFVIAAASAASDAGGESGDPPKKRLLILPYPFFNDTIGTGIGAAVVAEGYVQPQMLAVGSGLFSADGTYMIFAMVRNYQFPWIDRLIIEPQTAIGSFVDVKSYTLNRPGFTDERAGSNDSHEDNFIEADGDDFWFDFTIKYLLPLGHGHDNVFPKLKLDNGIFVSGDTGGEHWNPLTSGRTFIELVPFYRNQDLDDDDDIGEKVVQKTAGIDVALFHDNTNFRLNPSRGSSQRIFYSRDWGGFDSSRPWTVVGAEFDKYFDLGPSESARQRVIALNLYTVDCLTWKSSHTEDGREVFHRPPTYKGASLGGLWRMRGFPATRFNDRSAIYYAAEYRHTLNWNPLEDFTLGGRLDVDWFQLVGYGELGRVAPSWNFDELHSDMKWCLGAGLRVMANNIIVRADFGFSEEDGIVQLFIGHPF